MRNRNLMRKTKRGKRSHKSLAASDSSPDWDFTSTQVRIAQDSGIAQRAADREQHEIDREGHLTDIFVLLVEMLNSNDKEHETNRIGAIYALEGIARQSANDQAAVIELLATFVRTRSPSETTSQIEFEEVRNGDLKQRTSSRSAIPKDGCQCAHHHHTSDYRHYLYSWPNEKGVMVKRSLDTMAGDLRVDAEAALDVKTAVEVIGMARGCSRDRPSS